MPGLSARTADSLEWQCHNTCNKCCCAACHMQPAGLLAPAWPPPVQPLKSPRSPTANPPSGLVLQLQGLSGACQLPHPPPPPPTWHLARSSSTCLSAFLLMIRTLRSASVLPRPTDNQWYVLNGRQEAWQHKSMAATVVHSLL